jgi:transposase
MLTDTQWAMLEPLVEQCRPKGKTPPQDLRRTFEAILWRHENGAKWRAAPTELGPWCGPLSPSCAGLAWVSGSACSTWRKSAGSSSE